MLRGEDCFSCPALSSPLSPLFSSRNRHARATSARAPFRSPLWARTTGRRLFYPFRAARQAMEGPRARAAGAVFGDESSRFLPPPGRGPPVKPWATGTGRGCHGGANGKTNNYPRNRTRPANPAVCLPLAAARAMSAWSGVV